MTKPAKFTEWLHKNHPEVHLLPWQQQVAATFDTHFHYGSGKTYLIKLLSEFDWKVYKAERRARR